MTTPNLKAEKLILQRRIERTERRLAAEAPVYRKAARNLSERIAEIGDAIALNRLERRHEREDREDNRRERTEH